MRSQLLLLVSLIFLSCKSTQKTYDMQVINGKNAGKRYPAVRSIEVVNSEGDKGVCTGTFISDYQFITAAHCVHNAQKVALRIPFWPDKDAEAWVGHPKYNHELGAVPSFQYDLAIIAFPRYSSDEWMELELESPRLNKTYTMVGFGTSDPLASVGLGFGQGGKKQYGDSVFIKQTGNVLEGAPYYIEDDQGSASAVGDSGGPTLVENEIVGIIVGNKTDLARGVILSYVFDLGSEEGRSFLESQGF